LKPKALKPGQIFSAHFGARDKGYPAETGLYIKFLFLESAAGGRYIKSLNDFMACNLRGGAVYKHRAEGKQKTEDSMQ